MWQQMAEDVLKSVAVWGNDVSSIHERRIVNQTFVRNHEIYNRNANRALGIKKDVTTSLRDFTHHTACFEPSTVDRVLVSLPLSVARFSSAPGNQFPFYF
jgi:hypothetical protein